MTIRETRRWANIVLIVIVAVCVACVGVLLSPLAKSRTQREADLRDMQAELKDKETELGPSQGMGVKIEAARVNISSFYNPRNQSH